MTVFIDGSTWRSEEIRKISWMREERRRNFRHMELGASQNETEWLFKYHDCIVNNIPEERWPPMPLPISPDYVQNLGRRAKMAIKGVLPTPLKMMLNTHYPLRSQPLRPSPQCDVPSQRPPAQQSPPPQQCSGTKVVAAEETTVERSAKAVRVYMKGSNEGRMDPDRGQLESPSAGTGFETPGQQCLPNWEM